MKDNATIFSMVIVIKKQWKNNPAPACLRSPFHFLKTILSMSGCRDLQLVFLLVKNRQHLTFFLNQEQSVCEVVVWATLDPLFLLHVFICTTEISFLYLGLKGHELNQCTKGNSALY